MIGFVRVHFLRFNGRLSSARCVLWFATDRVDAMSFGARVVKSAPMRVSTSLRESHFFTTLKLVESLSRRRLI